MKNSIFAVTAAFATASLAAAQNDECTTASVIALGTTAFDTTTATLSPEAWPCAGGGGPDLWYSYTTPNTNAVRFETCGTSYDTALEIFTGTCGSLVSLVCNDDACGLQSSVLYPGGAMGTTFYVRVGGFAGNVGTGTITATEITPATNDECATAAMASLNTSIAFDTSSATMSPTAWPCAGGGGPDLWWEITSSSTMDLRFETCGSSYDTSLEVFTGTCGALVPVDCNDDACGLQSVVTVGGVTSGTTYYVRVGGFAGNTGSGTLLITETTPPPPPPPLTNNCVETIFASNNFGNQGGAIYFDLTATANVSISGMLTNSGQPVGTPIGYEVYTTPMTYQGNAGNAAAWTLVAADDGLTVSAGLDQPTVVNFLAPFSLNAGTHGIAIIGSNALTGLQTEIRYTNGNGTNQNFASADGVLSTSHGAADNVPWSGGAFTPRVWNGRLCHGMATPGINYCGPAVVNSTGNSATMSASGSASVMSNDLTLEANDMPNNAFGFFLTSMTQGFSPMPGGSAGNLCLGGSIGRFVGAGQIQNSGATGSISLLTNNSQWPTPGGLVQVNAGETWNCQAWFRDMSPAGGATSNFTDGLEITFSM